VLNQIAPPELAEPWDNCVLQIGRTDWPVKRVWVALDPLPEVVQAACRDGAQLLVCHHPLLFAALKRIDFATSMGATIELAAKSGLAIFAAHTNLDKAAGGINAALAQRLGLVDLSPLTTSAVGAADGGGDLNGLGRVGTLTRPCTLADLAKAIKADFRLDHLQMAGRADLQVRRVAVCSGSGGSLVQAFLAGPAQVLVSGDLRYHDARSVEAAGRGLVDIGHFASEQIAIALLKSRLDEALARKGIGVEVVACPLEKEPFTVL